MKLWPFVLAVCVLLLFVFLSGCGGTLSTLAAVVDAAAAAVPVLEAAGVPIPPAVAVYVADVASCIGSAGGAPTPLLLAQIGGCLGTTLAPTLPIGTPQVVAKVLSAIVQAVEKFLAQRPPRSISAGQALKPLSDLDTRQFEELRMRANLTAAKARALAVSK